MVKKPAIRDQILVAGFFVALFILSAGNFKR